MFGSCEWKSGQTRLFRLDMSRGGPWWMLGGCSWGLQFWTARVGSELVVTTLSFSVSVTTGA